MTREKGV